MGIPQNYRAPVSGHIGRLACSCSGFPLWVFPSQDPSVLGITSVCPNKLTVCREGRKKELTALTVPNCEFLFAPCQGAAAVGGKRQFFDTRVGPPEPNEVSDRGDSRPKTVHGLSGGRFVIGKALRYG